MARHDQSQPETKVVCLPCKDEHCFECIDVLRVVAGLDPICGCKLPNHSGEPRDAQVLDPETEVVFAPGLLVRKDGEIQMTRRGEIIAAAKLIHDTKCSCDPKYLMSCAVMAASILEQGGKK